MFQRPGKSRRYFDFFFIFLMIFSQQFLTSNDIFSGSSPLHITDSVLPCTGQLNSSSRDSKSYILFFMYSLIFLQVSLSTALGLPSLSLKSNDSPIIFFLSFQKNIENLLNMNQDCRMSAWVQICFLLTVKKSNQISNRNARKKYFFTALLIMIYIVEYRPILFLLKKIEYLLNMLWSSD